MPAWLRSATEIRHPPVSIHWAWIGHRRSRECSGGGRHMTFARQRSMSLAALVLMLMLAACAPARPAANDAGAPAAAADARTVTVKWTQPYVDADQMFTVAYGYLLPKHILEAPYREDKASLVQLPFWTTSFVGSGPYRLKEFNPGSGFVLEAFDAF